MLQEIDELEFKICEKYFLDVQRTQYSFDQHNLLFKGTVNINHYLKGL